MEDQPTSAGAEPQAAPRPPARSYRAKHAASHPTWHAASGSGADSAHRAGSADGLPQTHAEWTAFAALPPSERADVYIRALRSMTAVVATLAVAGPIAVAILALPRAAHGRARSRRLPALACLGR